MFGKQRPLVIGGQCFRISACTALGGGKRGQISAGSPAGAAERNGGQAALSISDRVRQPP